MAVAYTEETASRASAWLAASASKRRTADHVAELHALYSLISGQPVSSCAFCQFAHYVEVLTAYVRHFQHLSGPTPMADSTYSIAPGFENETFVHESFSEAVTAGNLTDKAAEFFIKNGFEHAFVKNKAAKTEAAGKPLTPKQQAVAEYKELFGEEPDTAHTEAKLRELISAKQAELDTERD